MRREIRVAAAVAVLFAFAALLESCARLEEGAGEPAPAAGAPTRVGFERFEFQQEGGQTGASIDLPRLSSQAERARNVSEEISVFLDVRKNERERRVRTRTNYAVTNDGEAPVDLDDLLAGGADELWIIERAATRGEPSGSDDTPGSGALVTRRPDSSELVPVPLEHTDVRGRISGYIATVDVRQSFHNPFDTKIEASYVFPLPHDAAVTDFVMVIGERKIRGIIRERQEAQRIYDAARSRGHVASLLTQERPNIFTQKVANIEPGKRIDIEIRYFHTLRYVDGGYEFVFPMVVGPRFNPPGTTDGVGAVARGARGSSGQSTEVSYLRPTERSGHDISLTVEIDAGVKIEKLECPSHVILREEVDPEERDDSIARVRLSPLDTIPNRDFVLRYRVAGRSIKAEALTHRDERGGFFTLMIYPPEDLAGLDREPTELIFVLDCSGSMKGWPLAKAKQAAERALKGLRPGDTFQIIRFSSSASQLGPAPVPASRRNVERGLAYLHSLKSSGGTHMIEGIKAALDFPHDSERLRVVSFLTDGYIGNERQIFQAIHERLGSARIFSFGVGNSVNRHLLEGMARLGRGAAAFVGTDESAARVVDLFYERVNHPALSGVEIDWGGLAVSEVFPKRLPDLLVGRPIVLTGRFEGSGKHVVRIRGRAGSAEREIPIELDLGSAERHAGIASVWARRTIQVLSESLSRGRGADELPAEIRRVALEHNLVSAYTAFVAVDSLTRTAGDHGVEVPVAVPVPTGVKYDTTVGK